MITGDETTLFVLNIKTLTSKYIIYLFYILLSILHNIYDTITLFGQVFTFNWSYLWQTNSRST